MIRFLGTRGTIPVSGSRFVKYGGNSPCLILPVDEKRCIIIDGGTGIYKHADVGHFDEYHIFLTHLHWDHICGIPLFSPLYNKNKTIHIYMEKKPELDSELLHALFRQPFFPISKKELKSKVYYHTIENENKYFFGDVEVHSGQGCHPGGALMFKLIDRGVVTLFVTDYEHGTSRDDFLIEFGRDCNYLVYDTTYTPAEYTGENGGISKKGWGHSTFEKGVELAKKGNMKNFVLFHHNPEHDDQKLDAMSIEAKKLFPNSICSFDGFEIS